MRQNERSVRRFLERVTRGIDADDLAQETFLRAWRLARSFRGEGSYAGWLLRIAWRVYLTRVGRSKRGAEVPLHEREEPVYSAGYEAAIDVDRAMATLAPRERAAALLCLAEGWSHSEAADILDLPLGTLKSLVARAKRQLVSYLEGQRP